MRSIAFVIVFMALSACQSTPTIQTGPNAEISYDGLVKLNNTRIDSAWIRPGIDLSAYDKLILEGAGIRYRSVSEVNRIYLSNFQGMPIDTEQVEYIQRAVRDVFTRGMAESEHFEIVEEPGPDTLTLNGYLIDVVSFVPPQDDTVDRIYHYITQLGEATLVLELRDSLSGQTLARATDRRILEPSFSDINADIAVNRFEVERELDRWVDTIRNGLEYLANTPILPEEK